LIISGSVNIVGWDPTLGQTMSISSAYMERLTADNWTIDPTAYSYSTSWRPPDDVGGNLAKSWEFTDPSTLVFHLRQGIHWQNISPVNGREFTADDVVYHYDRLYGLGSGLPPSPNWAYWKTTPIALTLLSVTATDKYTAVFKWKTQSVEYILENIQALGGEQCIDAHEVVEKWGDLNDWHHAIGTGPFILTDFVSGSSATLVKNPNYWGYDERYPQNQLPYIDTLKVLIIPDPATALAGVRTGKVDVIDGISLQNAQQMKKTNPEVLQLTYPSSTIGIEPRYDKAPFNDIKVRKAMQMAVDLPTIASTFYGGTTDPYPSALTARSLKGLGWPYEQWPQDLKDEYAYNPTAAKKLLADAGYPTGFKTNVVADIAGDLDLLQIVKSYFAAVGIDMSIQTMDSASWSSFVRTNHKNDALVYRVGCMLGLNYEPLRQLNRFVTGYAANDIMFSDPVFDSFLPKALAATSEDQVKQILRDANEFIARQHPEISLLTPNVFALYQPWLKGYSGQNMSISGTGSGILQMGFYTSRFWIDSVLKKSMGH